MFATSKIAGAVATAANYIEDVFSTYLYSGNNSTQTITNGIDLATKGGLVWVKGRNSSSGGSADNMVFDTARGAGYRLVTNNTSASYNSGGNYLTSFNSSGFSVNNFDTSLSVSGINYASWTFRKQPKFFDVVTYTGNGVTSRAVPHTLGSAPGFVIIKATSTTSNWPVYHRGSGGTQFWTQGELNSTAALSNMAGLGWLAPTSTDFYPGYIRDSAGNSGNVNGVTYVAYLFAHDAGGFGTAGTDNVISCGSFTTDASANATVNLGYEPQWMLVKCSSATEEWRVVDNMRGFFASDGTQPTLYPNLSSSELNAGFGSIRATGLQTSSLSPSSTYIYIAIRRGPMKTPTSGTSVFSPIASTGPSGTTLTTNFPVDSQWHTIRTGGISTTPRFSDRLRGVNSTSASTLTSYPYLYSSATSGETLNTDETKLWNNTGFQSPGNWGSNSMIYWNFGRAPKFFDMVCYTGTGTSLNPNHNLSVAPELKIIKRRDGVGGWVTGGTVVTTNGQDKYIMLDTTAAVATTTSYWDSGLDTATTFSTRTNNANTNTSGSTYIAYLFASCPGVSKVGIYSGTGGAQTIDCGFTTGARFVLLKPYSTTGSWGVFDTARGIVVGSDPILYINLTTAESSADVLTPQSVGFGLAGSSYNLSGQTYLFLAIA